MTDLVLALIIGAAVGLVVWSEVDDRRRRRRDRADEDARQRALLRELRGHDGGPS